MIYTINSVIKKKVDEGKIPKELFWKLLGYLRQDKWQEIMVSFEDILNSQSSILDALSFYPAFDYDKELKMLKNWALHKNSSNSEIKSILLELINSIRD